MFTANTEELGEIAFILTKKTSLMDQTSLDVIHLTSLDVILGQCWYKVGQGW